MALGIPFVLFALFMPPVKLKTFTSGKKSRKAKELESALKASKTLRRTIVVDSSLVGTPNIADAESYANEQRQLKFSHSKGSSMRKVQNPGPLGEALGEAHEDEETDYEDARSEMYASGSERGSFTVRDHRIKSKDQKGMGGLGIGSRSKAPVLVEMTAAGGLEKARNEKTYATPSGKSLKSGKQHYTNPSYEAKEGQDLEIGLQLSEKHDEVNDEDFLPVLPPKSKWQRMIEFTSERWQSVWTILSHLGWNYNNMGYVFIEFILIIYSYWGPLAALKIFPDEDSNSIDLLLGGATVVAGIVGSIGGGLLLDWMGSSLVNAFKISFVASCLAATFLLLGFVIPGLDLISFCALAGLGILFLTMVNPINYAMSMWTVPPLYRPMSQALINFSQRCFADLPGPPVAGAIYGALGSWYVTMPIILSLLSISIVSYLLGIIQCGNKPDYRLLYEEKEKAAIEREEQGADSRTPTLKRQVSPKKMRDLAPALPYIEESPPPPPPPPSSTKKSSRIIIHGHGEEQKHQREPNRPPPIPPQEDSDKSSRSDNKAQEDSSLYL